MKLSQNILILLSFLICFSQIIYSSQASSSSSYKFLSKYGSITGNLSNLIQESYKKFGLEKTLQLLNKLKTKLSNDEELTNDIDLIINKISIKNSINEEIIFPATLSNIILDYANPNEYAEFYNFKIYEKEISNLVWAPDGKYLAIIYSEDKNIKILNIETDKVQTLVGHTKNVEKIAWSHDGQRLACSAECTIRIWEVNSVKSIQEFGKDIHQLAASCLAFSPDGKYLASADWNGHIFIWDANTFELLNNLKDGEGNCVKSICWSPDSNWLATYDSYYYNKITLWDMNNIGQKKTLCCSRYIYHPLRFNSMAYTNNNKYIITGCDGYPNKLIWRFSDFKDNIPFDIEDLIVIPDHYTSDLEDKYDCSSVYGISCSYDNKMFITSSGAGITKIWDIEKKDLIQDLTDKENKIKSIAWSPNSDIFAVGCQNGEIKLYGKIFGKQF